MQRTITADGKVYVEGGSEYPWGKALAYALNNRQELYAFTTNGDMPVPTILPRDRYDHA